MGAAVMGTVLGVTLGMSFAAIDVPAVIGEDPSTTVGRLSSTGGRALGNRVRSGYDALAREVAGAVVAGDTGRLAVLADESSLPASVRGRLSALTMGTLPSMPAAAREQRGGEVGAEVEAWGVRQGDRVDAEVRHAFLQATTRVYLLSAWLMVVALLLATRIPEIPLRKTHDHAVTDGGQ